jgi:sugar-phosphatase
MPGLIVTSGSTELAKARLERAGLPIPRVLIAADAVTQGKPSPEPYLLGAKQLGLAPERCVVIEDAPAGIEAGRKAGMRIIGIAATHTQAELFEKGADIVAAQLTDIEIYAARAETCLSVRLC